MVFYFGISIIICNWPKLAAKYSRSAKIHNCAFLMDFFSGHPLQRILPTLLITWSSMDILTI